VTFHIPETHARSRTWEFNWDKREVGLEWRLNGKPIGLEVYSPFDWSKVDQGLANLFIGGLAWERDGKNLPGPVAGLKNLVSAGIANCPALANVDLLSACGGLRHLFLSGAGLRDLEALQLLPLESLWLMDTRHIRSLSFLRGLPRLRRLVLRNCRGLTDLSALAGHPSLRHLLIDQVPVRDLTSLAGLPALEKLHLERLPAAGTLPPLAGAAKLRALTVRECPRMRDPGRLPESVRELWLERIAGWDWKSLLAGSPLRALDLVSCGITQAELPVIASIPTLERLALSGNTLLRSIHPLGSLTALQTLHLDYCLGLESLSGLGRLTGLTELSLTLCLRLGTLSPLASLEGLVSLSLAGLPRRAQAPGYLARLTGLRQLSLAGWDAVADFSFLEAFRGLEYLDLRGRIFQKSSEAIGRLPELCYLYHTFFAMYERPDPKRPRQPFRRPFCSSRNYLPNPGSQPTIRGTWWDLPRPSRWDPDLMVDRAPCRDLEESVRSAMLSLLPKPAREVRAPFLIDERPRPGSPHDLEQRRSQVGLPEPSTNSAAVAELLELDWAEDPFVPGNRMVAYTAELALQLDQLREGEPLFGARPVDEHLTQTEVFRRLARALNRFPMPRPGSGQDPRANAANCLVLTDPEAPSRKVRLEKRKEGDALVRILKEDAGRRMREIKIRLKEIKANLPRGARAAMGAAGS
jgi:Leucine-rich repeat (LRR) protein